MHADPQDRLRPSGPPNPARFREGRSKKFRRLRRWYRRTPTGELVMTLAAVGVLVLVAVGALVYALVA